MIEQILEKPKARRSTLLDEYMAAEAEMRVLHDGAAMRCAVDAVLGQLPSCGQITLLATSPQGIGLAAATAARRREPTTWQPLDTSVGLQHPPIGAVVIVEPVDPGHGWQSTIRRIVPCATFVFTKDESELLAA